MRFTLNDWLWLGVACMLASVAKAALGALAMIMHVSILLTHAPVAGPDVTSRPVSVTLAVISALVDGLAMWTVLRHCVGGLRLGPWLLAVVGGVLADHVLHAVAGLNMPQGIHDLLTSGGDPAHLFARWLTMLGIGVAPFLLPGLLLQRLTGAGAWPFIGLGALSVIIPRLALPILMPSVPDYAYAYLGLVGLMLAMSVVSGAYQGLSAGAGLYLMERRAARPAAAA